MVAEVITQAFVAQRRAPGWKINGSASFVLLRIMAVLRSLMPTTIMPYDKFRSVLSSLFLNWVKYWALLSGREAATQVEIIYR